jgi:penicillin-binding protein 2
MDVFSSSSDKQEALSRFNSRLFVIFAVVIILTIVLISRVYYLQVIKHDEFETLSEKNRVQSQPVSPVRGLIYDRKGRLLAENVPGYRLSIVKEQVDSIPQTLELLSSLVSISEREKKQFLKTLGNRRRPFQPVTLKTRLTQEEIARVSVNQYFLPGVEVEAELVRHYPYGEYIAHAIGYVGRINDKDQARINRKEYSGTRFIGKIGIEKFYEQELFGKVGYRKVETNARGRVLREIERVDPIPGKDIRLHLDIDVQKTAIDAMGSWRGSVVAIDVKTGGIIALASTPSYDPNNFVQGISTKNYSALRDSPDKPLFNRGLRGRYPPGSTMKPFIGLAGLEHNIVNRRYSIDDVGWYQLPNDDRLYRDWKRKGHGKVNLRRAMIESCDVYFYEMGYKMGIDRMEPLLYQFGFGQNLGLDVPDALTGLLPTREWKRKRLRSGWYAGDTLNMSIGQGYMLATPFQLAQATAVLANKGEWLRPRYANSVGDYTFRPLEVERHADVKLKNYSDWEYMFKAMEGVITHRNGTAHVLNRNLPYRMAGKSGTAQVVGIKQNEVYKSDELAERNRDHALFIAFAPVDDPQIAVAVIVENGESAIRTAGPVAKAVMDNYLLGNNKKKRKR